MKFALYAAVVAAASFSSPALAQDSDTSGGKFVAGGILGVDSVELEAGGISDSDENIVVGVTIGYDFEFNTGFVVGVEGEYTDSSVGVDYTDILAAGDRFSVNAGRDFYAGVRVGVRTGDLGLIYVKAGYTNAAIEGEYDDGFSEIADQETISGFRVGVGGEFDFSSNASLRLEYRYSDYGEVTIAGINTGVDASRHQGIVTLVAGF